MKIAFVTKVKEKDLKTLFPWMEKAVPMMGGFVVLDAVKISALQSELVTMAKTELLGMKKREKERARMEKRHAAFMKRNGLDSSTLIRPINIPKRRRG